MEYLQHTLSEASELLSRGETTAEELTNACLERIQDHDGDINAFITITTEVALEQARAADRALQDDLPVGPLHGIPLSLKDLFETRGIRTTAGSRVLSDFIPTQDCEVYKRFVAAGAVLLGKTNMHEFAFGVTSQNPHYGPVRNPWDLSRISGGSSGGSAAAVAVGMGFGALGTDTGGSVRIPAALCGVVGLKPTFGRVSVGGVIPLSRSLDHVGPLARTVADAATLFQVISGDKSGGTTNIQFSSEGAQQSAPLEGFQIALASDPYFLESEEVVLEAVRAAASAFEALGARVEEAAFPGAEEAQRANVTILLAEAAAYHAPFVESDPQKYSVDVLERLERGAALQTDEIEYAQATQKNLRINFAGFFDHFDLLLTPTTPQAATRIDHSDPLQAAPSLTRYTAPFNLTGLPAIALPCGFTLEGLPLSLQIVGPPGSEWKLLQAAHAYEQHASWFRRHPA